jgi:hypothetical protein
MIISRSTAKNTTIIRIQFFLMLLNNMKATEALKLGSGVWVLKKRDEQRLEAAQMKFLRHLLAICAG